MSRRIDQVVNAIVHHPRSVREDARTPVGIIIKLISNVTEERMTPDDSLTTSAARSDLLRSSTISAIYENISRG